MMAPKNVPICRNLSEDVRKTSEDVLLSRSKWGQGVGSWRRDRQQRRGFPPFEDGSGRLQHI